MSDEKQTSPVVAGFLIYMGLMQLLMMTAKLWHQYDGSWWTVFYPTWSVVLCFLLSTFFARKPPE